jgi:hypothetical protein
LQTQFVDFFAMKTTFSSPTERKSKANADWLKTPYPNLVRYKPIGTYFGRVWVNGKLIPLWRNFSPRSLYAMPLEQRHELRQFQIRMTLGEYRRMMVGTHAKDSRTFVSVP